MFLIKKKILTQGNSKFKKSSGESNLKLTTDTIDQLKNIEQEKFSSQRYNKIEKFK